MVYVRIVNVTTAVVRDRWRGLHQMQQHQQQPVCMHHDVLQCVFTILAQITSVVDQEMCRQSVVRDMKKVLMAAVYIILFGGISREICRIFHARPSGSNNSPWCM
jgi:hypothetical protein